MLIWLLKWWMAHPSCTCVVQIPAAFFYCSTRMVLAALTSLFFSLCLFPFFITKLRYWSIGQKIREEHCETLAILHETKKETPTMGGVLILLGSLLSLFLWADLKEGVTWILALTTVLFGFLGGIDDYLKIKKNNTRGLPSKWKFFGQGMVVLLLSAYLLFPSVHASMEENWGIQTPYAKEYSAKTGEVQRLKSEEFLRYYYFPFVKTPLKISHQWSYVTMAVLAFFVISGTSNGVNLTDGLDGLATGCLLILLAVFAIVAFLSNHSMIASYLNILYIGGSGEIAIYLSSVFGGALGFLWYNGYPAQVFMGDTGSLSLGGIVGVCAILLRREFLLVLVGGVFVMEVLSVILQVLSYRLFHKRIFLCAPLHHHFEYKGVKENKIVLRFWIIALLLALIGLLSLKLQ